MLRGVVISIKHLTTVWCMRPAAAWRRSGEKNCCSQMICKTQHLMINLFPAVRFISVPTSRMQC